MTKADNFVKANRDNFLVEQLHGRDAIIVELRQQVSALHKDKADLAELVKNTQAEFAEYKKPRTDIVGFGIGGRRAKS